MHTRSNKQVYRASIDIGFLRGLQIRGSLFPRPASPHAGVKCIALLLGHFLEEMVTLEAVCPFCETALADIKAGRLARGTVEVVLRSQTLAYITKELLLHPGFYVQGFHAFLARPPWLVPTVVRRGRKQLQQPPGRLPGERICRSTDVNNLGEVCWCAWIREGKANRVRVGFPAEAVQAVAAGCQSAERAHSDTIQAGGDTPEQQPQLAEIGARRRG